MMPLPIIQPAANVTRIAAIAIKIPVVYLDPPAALARHDPANGAATVPRLVGEPRDVVVLGIARVLAPPGKGEVTIGTEIQVGGVSQADIAARWKIRDGSASLGLVGRTDDAGDVG